MDPHVSLHNAAKFGSQFDVQKALDAGADCTSLAVNGKTAAENAALHGNPELARFLVEQGSEIRLRTVGELMWKADFFIAKGEIEHAEFLSSLVFEVHELALQDTQEYSSLQDWCTSRIHDNEELNTSFAIPPIQARISHAIQFNDISLLKDLLQEPVDEIVYASSTKDNFSLLTFSEFLVTHGPVTLTEDEILNQLLISIETFPLTEDFLTQIPESLPNVTKLATSLTSYFTPDAANTKALDELQDDRKRRQLVDSLLNDPDSTLTALKTSLQEKSVMNFRYSEGSFIPYVNDIRQNTRLHEIHQVDGTKVFAQRNGRYGVIDYADKEPEFVFVKKKEWTEQKNLEAPRVPLPRTR